MRPDVVLATVLVLLALLWWRRSLVLGFLTCRLFWGIWRSDLGAWRLERISDASAEDGGPPVCADSGFGFDYVGRYRTGDRRGETISVRLWLSQDRLTVLRLAAWTSARSELQWAALISRRTGGRVISTVSLATSYLSDDSEDCAVFPDVSLEALWTLHRERIGGRVDMVPFSAASVVGELEEMMRQRAVDVVAKGYAVRNRRDSAKLVYSARGARKEVSGIVRAAREIAEIRRRSAAASGAARGALVEEPPPAAESFINDGVLQYERTPAYGYIPRQLGKVQAINWAMGALALFGVVRAVGLYAAALQWRISLIGWPPEAESAYRFGVWLVATGLPAALVACTAHFLLALLLWRPTRMSYEICLCCAVAMLLGLCGGLSTIFSVLGGLYSLATLASGDVRRYLGDRASGRVGPGTIR